MSVSHSKRIAKTRPAIDYETFGAIGSAKYREHKANGTDRIAAMRCDCGTQFEFADKAEHLRDAFGRKVEAISLIQSFQDVEFDPNDPSRVQYVNDLGYEFGKRLAPDSDVLVITHVDGEGGHPHNHVKIMNHVNPTGRALRLNTMHYAVSRVNDSLMREHGLNIVTRGEKSGQYQSYWEMQRDGESVSLFEQQLGDLVMEARIACDNTLDGYKAQLDSRGIDLVEETHLIKASADGKQPEHESVGWTYRMRDVTGEKPRLRRRKASSLAGDLTHGPTMAFFAQRSAELAAQQAAQQQADLLAAQQDAQLADDGLDLSEVQREWYGRVEGMERFDALLAMTAGGLSRADSRAVMDAHEARLAALQGHEAPARPASAAEPVGARTAPESAAEVHENLAETAGAAKPVLYDVVMFGNDFVRTPSTYQMRQAGYSDEDIERALRKAESPESGDEIPVDAGYIEDADFGVETADLEAEKGSLVNSGSETGRQRVENGSETGSASEGAQSDSLENEETGSSGAATGSSSADLAHSEPVFDPKLVTELPQGAPTELPQTSPSWPEMGASSRPAGKIYADPGTPDEALSTRSADAPALAGSGGSAAPTPPPKPIRSTFRDKVARNAEERKKFDRWADGDEYCANRIRAGLRLEETEVKKYGVGPRFLRDHGDELHPATRQQMELRVAKFAAKNEEHETWVAKDKAIKEGRATAEKQHDLNWQYSDEFNALVADRARADRQKKELEEQIAAGVYEPVVGRWNKKLPPRLVVALVLFEEEQPEPDPDPQPGQ